MFDFPVKPVSAVYTSSVKGEGKDSLASTFFLRGHWVLQILGKLLGEFPLELCAMFTELGRLAHNAE